MSDALLNEILSELAAVKEKTGQRQAPEPTPTWKRWAAIASAVVAIAGALALATATYDKISTVAKNSMEAPQVQEALKKAIEDEGKARQEADAALLKRIEAHEKLPGHPVGEAERKALRRDINRLERNRR